jgi:hypothetical protein
LDSGALSNATARAVAVTEFDRGVRLFRQRNIVHALDRFQNAESMGYDSDLCASYRWQCWMLLGNFEGAWQESDRIDCRDNSRVNSQRYVDPHALWDGLPLTGERVLIRCLHGYGDAIQFLRYATQIRRSAARVIVETHPEIISLIERVQGVDKVATCADGGAPGPEDWDQQIEVTELPRAFRTKLAEIPSSIPYIDIGAGERRHSACNQEGAGKLKIGLVWASSTWNPARSLRLSALRPVLENSGRCRFYGFQRGPEREQLKDFLLRYSIHDTAEHSPRILDTAADLSNMDLLITVDTMAAHLAGALGKSVWTLLPHEADWRWMLHRRDSPSYPTMRLFRQTSSDDWGPVIRRVAEELSRFAP